jgi:uncharacterized protein YndB with AHSA1/START domain
MSIAPIVCTVQVKTSPGRAFELFTTHMERWWLKSPILGGRPYVAIVVEPLAGGRWFERDADGVETEWGKVLAWAPPTRILLRWQVNTRRTFDRDLSTELALTFAPAEGGGALVSLEHRHLEGFGADADEHAAKMRGGWPVYLAEFPPYADARS